jgi:hypothetical protein
MITRDTVATALALLSAGTPLAAPTLEPAEWAVSIGLSIVGSLIAVYIYEQGRARAARIRRHAAKEDERRRKELLDWERRLCEREILLEAALGRATDLDPSDTDEFPRA